jgi:hypothetical protein
MDAVVVVPQEWLDWMVWPTRIAFALIAIALVCFVIFAIRRWRTAPAR